MKLDTHTAKAMAAAAQRDPRIGRTLHEVLHPSTMLDAVRSAIEAESGRDGVPGLDVLDKVAERQFGAMTITALSYSPKKRRYQVAVRIAGPKPRAATMHLPQSAFLDDGRA